MGGGTALPKKVHVYVHAISQFFSYKNEGKRSYLKRILLGLSVELPREPEGEREPLCSILHTSKLSAGFTVHTSIYYSILYFTGRCLAGGYRIIDDTLSFRMKHTTVIKSVA